MQRLSMESPLYDERSFWDNSSAEVTIRSWEMKDVCDDFDMMLSELESAYIKEKGAVKQYSFNYSGCKMRGWLLVEDVPDSQKDIILAKADLLSGGNRYILAVRHYDWRKLDESNKVVTDYGTFVSQEYHLVATGEHRYTAQEQTRLGCHPGDPDLRERLTQEPFIQDEPFVEAYSSAIENYDTFSAYSLFKICELLRKMPQPV